jgi:hypothetical protein
LGEVNARLLVILYVREMFDSKILELKKKIIINYTLKIREMAVTSKTSNGRRA